MKYYDQCLPLNYSLSWSIKHFPLHLVLLITLENEETNKILKMIYIWYGRITILLLPLTVYSLCVSIAIEMRQQYFYYLKVFRDWTVINKYASTIFKMNDALGALALVCNLTSCGIMIGILRLLKQLTRPVVVGRDSIEQQRKINIAVTASHICVIFCYTLLTLLHYNIKATNNYYPGRQVTTVRVIFAWNLFGGVSDLFLTCMMWFILDDNLPKNVFSHSGKTYAVIEVVDRESINSEPLTTEINEDEDLARSQTIVERRVSYSLIA